MRPQRLLLVCLVLCLSPIALRSQGGDTAASLPPLATLKQLKFNPAPAAASTNAGSHDALQKAIQSFQLFRGGAPRVSGWRWNEQPKTRGPRETSVYNAAVNAVVYIEAALETATLLRTPKAATGTGTILAPDDLVLTAYHVVRGAHEGKFPIMVYLKPARSVEPQQSLAYLAHVEYFNATKDLAALRFNQAPPFQLSKLKIAAQSSLVVGETVHLVGHPLGATWSFGTGVISQIRPNAKIQSTGADGPPMALVADVVQLQSAVNPGNSGGPVLDDTASVVGVISGGPTEAMNYAIAASEIASFLQAHDKQFPIKGPSLPIPPPPSFTVSPLPGGGAVRKSEIGDYTAYTIYGANGAVKGVVAESKNGDVIEASQPVGTSGYRKWTARFADGGTATASGEKGEPLQFSNQ